MKSLSATIKMDATEYCIEVCVKTESAKCNCIVWILYML